MNTINPFMITKKCRMLLSRIRFLLVFLPLWMSLDVGASASRMPLEDIRNAYGAAEGALTGRAQALLVACRLYDDGFQEAAQLVYGGKLDRVSRSAAQRSAEGMLSSVDSLRDMFGRSVEILHLPDAERENAVPRHVGFLWQRYVSDRALMYVRQTCEEPYIASASPTIAELERYLDPSRYADQVQRAQAGRHFLYVLMKTFVQMLPAAKRSQSPLDLLGGASDLVADTSTLRPDSLVLFMSIVLNSMRAPLGESLAADKQLGDYLLGKKSLFPPAADEFVLVGRDERGRQTSQTILCDDFGALKLWIYGKSVLADKVLGPSASRARIVEFVQTSPYQKAWDILIGNWFVSRGNLRRFEKHPIYKPSSDLYRTLDRLVREAARYSEAQVSRAGEFLRGEVSSLEVPAATSSSSAAAARATPKKKNADRAVAEARTEDPHAASGGGRVRKGGKSDVAVAAASEMALPLSTATGDTSAAPSSVDTVTAAARSEALAREEAEAARRLAAELAIRKQIEEANRRLAAERRERRDEARASRLLTASLMSSSTGADARGVREDAAGLASADGSVAMAADATEGLPLLRDAPPAVQSFAHIVSSHGLATRDHIRDALEGLARSVEGFALAEGAGSRINVQHRSFGSLTLHLPHNGMVSVDAGATRSPYRMILESLYADFR